MQFVMSSARTFSSLLAVPFPARIQPPNSRRLSASKARAILLFILRFPLKQISCSDSAITPVRIASLRRKRIPILRAK